MWMNSLKKLLLYTHVKPAGVVCTASVLHTLSAGSLASLSLLQDMSAHENMFSHLVR